MTRWFNTAGPCKADIHYMLPPVERLPTVERIIDQQGYFVLHAPRQTGKSTAMIALGRQLTATGRYTAVMLSVEVGSAFPQDTAAAELAILSAWRSAARFRLPADLQPPPWPEAPPGQQIRLALEAWTQNSTRPLVVFIDEIDSLQNEVLVSVLRQLRDGYPVRPEGFPYSLALIGLRDVRDYKVASGGSDRLNTASPFNIKVQSLTLRDFNAAEVAQLYALHTQDTGQVFTTTAVERAFELSQGQPWLVNALAKEIVEEIVIDPTQPVEVEHFEQAKETLIQRRDTHLDSLAERLREPRVRAIIEPMLAGEKLGTVPNEDLEFLVDLGLCRMGKQGGLVIANPIYQEVLPHVLSQAPQASLPQISPSWLTPAGALNSEKLLQAFLSFWQQHGEPLLKSAPYSEIAPHLVMMAFLDRVVNGGGTLTREYAIGSGRMDLCLRYGEVTLAIELRVWRDQRPDPLEKGLEQIDRYLSGLNLNTGWLVIFGRRTGLLPIEERTITETAATPNGRQIVVIRG